VAIDAVSIGAGGIADAGGPTACRDFEGEAPQSWQINDVRVVRLSPIDAIRRREC
jgi:hypothetical protein